MDVDHAVAADPQAPLTPEQIADLGKRVGYAMVSPNGMFRGIYSREDAVSDATLGALLANESYDPTRGNSRRSHVAWKAKLYVIDEIRRISPLGRRAYVDGARFETVGEESQPPLHYESFHTTLGDKDRHRQWHPPDHTATRSFEQVDARLTAQQLLDGLPEREAQIIHEYYFAERTLMDIGIELGITESRVGQIIRKAHWRMRAEADWFER